MSGLEACMIFRKKLTQDSLKAVGELVSKNSPIERNQWHSLVIIFTFIWGNIIPPEKIKCVVDFHQACMGKYSISDTARSVPFAVNIVAHKINPIDMLHHSLQIKPSKIPKRWRRGESNSKVKSSGDYLLAQLRHKFCIIWSVMFMAPTIGGSRIFPKRNWSEWVASSLCKEITVRSFTNQSLHHQIPTSA